MKLPTMSDLEDRAIRPYVAHMGALDGMASDWDMETENAREILWSAPGCETFSYDTIETCVNALSKNYHSSQNRRNKYSAERIWVGMNQLYLSDSMKSVLAPSELLALYDSFGELAHTGALSTGDMTYTKKELAEMGTDEAVSILVGSAIQNNVTLYNEVMRRQKVRPQKGSLKKRINSLNPVQQSTISRQIGMDYNPSMWESREGNWNHPGKQPDAKGASTRQYVPHIKGYLNIS